ncbi:MAG TPA: hypothetical protein VK726_26470 [Acetobacteraceae bacterium]|jgi:hypothetical protein|nr:hypothetical protein [Acetobacteraceae bacterium]
MSERNNGRKRAAKPPPTSPIELPDLPPKTETELAHERDMPVMMRQLAADLRQRNLDNAVRLAQQAAAGYGPLVEHFAELGRRYGAELLNPRPRQPRPHPGLRVVEGGRLVPPPAA